MSNKIQEILDWWTEALRRNMELEDHKAAVRARLRLHKNSNKDLCISDENEWEVIQIMDRKLVNGTLYYRILWKGGYNSWEPQRNLTHCDKLLRDFEADKS